MRFAIGSIICKTITCACARLPVAHQPHFRDRLLAGGHLGRASLARMRAPVRLDINLLISNTRTITCEDLPFIRLTC